MMAKGDYPAELNIPIPFSLISNDVSNNRLIVMPAYWFMYNMYALARNTWKYMDRDKRVDRTQYIEYDYLAPDSVNEIFTALELMIKFTGHAFLKKEGITEVNDEEAAIAGKRLLESDDPLIDGLEILAQGFENSSRKVLIIKVRQTYRVFKELIRLYTALQLIWHIKENELRTFDELMKSLPVKFERNAWLNIGGQLIPTAEVENIKKHIKQGKVTSWDALHDFYASQSNIYHLQKLKHSLGCLHELESINLKKQGKPAFNKLLDDAVTTNEWLTRGIYTSRAKDYTNPFRKLVYDSTEEMNAVTGALEDNSFIKQQQEEFRNFKNHVAALKKLFNSDTVSANAAAK
jgi:hypothetical protein